VWGVVWFKKGILPLLFLYHFFIHTRTVAII
jgi:hypothetical protein